MALVSGDNAIDDDVFSGEMGTGSAGRECDKLLIDLAETSGIGGGGWPITFGA